MRDEKKIESREKKQLGYNILSVSFISRIDSIDD